MSHSNDNRAGTPNIAVVGISHSSAPVDVLERFTLPEDQVVELVEQISGSGELGAAYALATCNRMEFYAEFPADRSAADGLAALRELVARRAGMSTSDVEAYVYQREGTDAVRHLFEVASGLDSIVVGEDQILGQVKDALTRSQRLSAASPTINRLVQTAIRLGKRARTETDINRAGRSLATVGLSALEEFVGPMTGRVALVIGAGSMGGVVVAALRRAGLDRVDVANRTPEKAAHLAATAGGQGHGLDDLPSLLATADLVVTCTTGTGVLIDREVAATAMASRAGRPLFLLDLALPRNIAADTDAVPGVTMVDLERLSGARPDEEALASVESVHKLIEDEVAAFLAAGRAAMVAPALTAMRAAAADTAGAELDRLLRRVPHLDEQATKEISQSFQRVVDKVLHGPTVRARELAGAPEGARYVELLGALFEAKPTNKIEVVA